MAKSKKQSTIEVNIHDDELMVSLGIRPPKLEEKDPSVWTKTSNERRILKSLRRKFKNKFIGGDIKVKPIPVLARITVNLHKNSIFPHTTYSKICYQHQIREFLDKFYDVDKNGLVYSLYDKYVYNGKTYEAGELPFWFNK